MSRRRISIIIGTAVTALTVLVASAGDAAAGGPPVTPPPVPRQSRADVHVASLTPASNTTSFVPIAPCRIADTRHGTGTNGKKLKKNNTRNLTVAGTTGFEQQGGKAGGCGIPATAQAVVLNAVVVSPSKKGSLKIWPTGLAEPAANFFYYGSFTTPENGTGGRMEGLELSGSLEGGLVADALDGFGVQANFSLTNSTVPQKVVGAIPGGAGSPPSTLPGLSRKVANLTLYYEKYGWSARIAERYRSSFTGEIVPMFNQIAYTRMKANKQTDLQLSYAFDSGKWKGLTLLFQVSNLTNSSDSKLQVAGLPDGEQVVLPQYYDTWGRTVMLGASYKL